VNQSWQQTLCSARAAYPADRPAMEELLYRRHGFAASGSAVDEEIADGLHGTAKNPYESGTYFRLRVADVFEEARRMAAERREFEQLRPPLGPGLLEPGRAARAVLSPQPCADDGLTAVAPALALPYPDPEAVRLAALADLIACGQRRKCGAPALGATGNWRPRRQAADVSTAARPTASVPTAPALSWPTGRPSTSHPSPARGYLTWSAHRSTATLPLAVAFGVPGPPQVQPD
jgi:hypothetical protein